MFGSNLGTRITLGQVVNMASLNLQFVEPPVQPCRLPDLTQLRQYAANILPQSERNGMELCFMAIAVGCNPEMAACPPAAMDTAANRILGCIRAGDYLAATGGAEFVVVLAAGCQQLAAARIAERVQQAIEKPLVLSGKNLRLSCRIGITATRDDVLDVDRIIANSSAALRQCSGSATGSIRHFSPVAQEHVERHLLVSRELDGALADGAIVPWFQPQISLATGELTGFEALVRWDHAQKGILAPAAFLDVAEASGQIEKIGEVVLTRSIMAIKEWHRSGFRVPRVAVNLSSAQLNNPYLAELIKWELERLDVARST